MIERMKKTTFLSSLLIAALGLAASAELSSNLERAAALTGSLSPEQDLESASRAGADIQQALEGEGKDAAQGTRASAGAKGMPSLAASRRMASRAKVAVPAGYCNLENQWSFRGREIGAVLGRFFTDVLGLTVLWVGSGLPQGLIGIGLSFIVASLFLRTWDRWFGVKGTAFGENMGGKVFGFFGRCADRIAKLFGKKS